MSSNGPRKAAIEVSSLPNERPPWPTRTKGLPELSRHRSSVSPAFNVCASLTVICIEQRPQPRFRGKVLQGSAWGVKTVVDAAAADFVAVVAVPAVPAVPVVVVRVVLVSDPEPEEEELAASPSPLHLSTSHTPPELAASPSPPSKSRRGFFAGGPAEASGPGAGSGRAAAASTADPASPPPTAAAAAAAAGGPPYVRNQRSTARSISLCSRNRQERISMSEMSAPVGPNTPRTRATSLAVDDEAAAAAETVGCRGRFRPPFAAEEEEEEAEDEEEARRRLASTSQFIIQIVFPPHLCAL